MNIFAIAWNMPDMDVDRVHAELRRLTSIYPILNAETIWAHHGANDAFCAASISTAGAAIKPRAYVHRNGDQTTFFAGLPVDPENACVAHRADSLRVNWRDVRERLEGTYAVVNLDDAPPRLEIQTDLLGGEPVYYLPQKHGWLISNSVLLMERLSGFRPLDALGVSMYLELGHALGDRTLRDGIRVIPGGQRWTWSSAANDPEMFSYYPLGELGKRRLGKITEPFVARLAADLQKPLAALGANFDSLVCPLTGGKDSRVIASLLIAAGIDTQYFTFGDPSGEDVKIASAIAADFGLQHAVLPVQERDVIDDWDTNCRKTVLAADGMRSLYLLGGMAKSRSIIAGKRDVYLWGACGEVARSFYGNLPFLSRSLTVDDIKEFLKKAGPENSYGLIQEDAIARAREWQDEFVTSCADEGVRLIDIPDLYGNHVVDGRRLGNNGRALATTRDTFTPYATRAFLEAAFSIRALQRYTEPLHFALTRHLNPALHSAPLGKDTWRSQRPLFNLLQMRIMRRKKRYRRKLHMWLNKIGRGKPDFHYQDSMFSRLNWLERERERILEVAADSASEPVWEFVRRDRFDSIMSPDTPPVIRSRNLQLLFHIATLVYYESDSERRLSWTESRSSKTGT